MLEQNYYGAEGTVWLVDGQPHVAMECEVIGDDFTKEYLAPVYIWVAGLIPLQKYLEGSRNFNTIMPLEWWGYDEMDYCQFRRLGLAVVHQTDLTRIKEAEWIKQGRPAPLPKQS